MIFVVVPYKHLTSTTQLQTLFLNGNHLTALPESFGQLVELRTVPPETGLCRWQGLRSARVHQWHRPKGGLGLNNEKHVLPVQCEESSLAPVSVQKSRIVFSACDSKSVSVRLIISMYLSGSGQVVSSGTNNLSLGVL